MLKNYERSCGRFRSVDIRSVALSACHGADGERALLVLDHEGGRTVRRCGRPELREAVLLGPAGGPDPGNNEATTPPPAVCGGRRPSWVPYRTDRHAMRTAVGSCRLRWPLPGCGPEGRGFESPRSPQASRASAVAGGHGKETSPIYADRVPGRVPSRRTRSPLAAPIPTTPNRWPPGPGTRAVPLVGCGHPGAELCTGYAEVDQPQVGTEVHVLRSGHAESACAAAAILPWPAAVNSPTMPTNLGCWSPETRKVHR